MSFRNLELTEDNRHKLALWFRGSDEARLHMLARQWIEANLDLVERKSEKSGNCYSEGMQVYRRKDGRPIDADTLDALNTHKLGQVNKVRQVNEMTVERFWACDSSG